MKTITLNLAGAFVVLGYTPRFGWVGLWDNDWKCWHPITQREGLRLDCGRNLTKADLVMTIKHKLSLI